MKTIKTNNILYAAVAITALTLISAAASAQGREPGRRGDARTELSGHDRTPGCTPGHGNAIPAPAHADKCGPDFHPAYPPCDAPRHHMRPAPRPVPVVIPVEPVVEPAPAPAPPPPAPAPGISVTLRNGVTISIG